VAAEPIDLDRRLLVTEVRQEELARATLDALAKIDARLTRLEEGVSELKVGLGKLEGKVDAKPSAVAVVGIVAVVNGAALGSAGLLRFVD
jgi:hypothetical protein